MTHRHTASSTVRNLSVASLFLLLAACTITGETTLDSSGMPQTGEWFVIGTEAEIHANSLAEAAQTANGKTAIDYRLRAADNYLMAGRYDLANNQLAKIDESSLAATNKTRYSTLRSRMELPPVSHRDDGYSKADVAERLAKRSNQLTANGYDEAAVKLRVLRSGLLSKDSKAENDEAIWNMVNRFSKAELATLPVQATDELVSWWSLGYLQASRKPDELAASYRWWQQRYPGYAANNAVFAKLTGKDSDQIAGENNSVNEQIVTLDIGQAPRNVALLLPISGRYAPAAKAIEAGFRAADAANETPLETVQIIDSVSKDIVDAYTDAVINGAQLIVGPLQKPQVAKLAYSGMISIPLLTLNDPVESKPATDESTEGKTEQSETTEIDPLEQVMEQLAVEELPYGLTVFGLSPEQEARQVALRAIADGKTRAAVLMPENDWGSRVGEAFREAFEAAGGQVVDNGPYKPGTNDLGRDVANLLKSNSRNPLWRDVGSFSSANRSIYEGDRRENIWTADRNQIDMAFMAAFPRDARILRPSFRFHQAIRLPIYATSHAYSGRPNPRFDADLNGLTFCDMPVLMPNPDDIATDNSNGDLDRYPPRLVALGRDARALVNHLAILQADPSQQLQGASGKLQLVGNRIERQLSCATFEDGNVTPLINDDPLESIEQNTDELELLQQSL